MVGRSSGKGQREGGRGSERKTASEGLKWERGDKAVKK